MCAMNARDNNITLGRALEHGRAWRVGAAIVAQCPKYLPLGLAAWLVFGTVTAALDPHGAGLISLLGGVAAWLIAGIGLAAAYWIAHSVARRCGRLIGGVAGAAALALVAVLLVVIDWNAVASGAATVLGFAAAVALIWRSWRLPGGLLSSDEDNANGAPYPHWRNHGLYGPGFYVNNMPLQDDDD